MDRERPRAPYRERRRRRRRDHRRRRHVSVSPDVCHRRRSNERSRSRSRSRERRRSRDRLEQADREFHGRSNTMASPQQSNYRQRTYEHAADGAVCGNGVATVERGGERERRGERALYDRGGRRSAPTRRSKLSVPDNWDDVAKIGALVASSRFVAMRVPLDDKFTRMIRSPTELWTPAMFLETQASEGHDVRLIIDLTNTTKYYDGEMEFHDSGVQYVKLCIEGFKAPPRDPEIEAFLSIVDQFVTAEPHGSIAVHCTHGLNRTGYLVVSYLVRRGGMRVQDALKAFSDARPPGLIKHMYVEDLFRRFAPDASVELPTLPDWATAKYAARRR